MALRHLLADTYCRKQHWDVRPLYEQLMQNQTRPRAELEALSQQLLLELLVHCAAHVPFYRERNCGASIDTYPVLSKTLIADHNAALLAEGVSRAGCVVGQGSGTTGLQASMLVDRRHLSWSQACWWRIDRFFGLPEHPRCVTLSNRLDRMPPTEQFKRWFGGMLLNRYVFYSTLQTDRGVASLTRWLQFYRPLTVTGILSPLLMYARAGTRLGLRPPASIRVVRPYGETLYDEERVELEQFFRAPVAMRYGTREVGSVAMECEHGNYHQSVENAYLEVLHDDGSITRQGRGRLLITTLQNRIMPLVRYDVGDVVTLEDGDCPCGRTLPLLGAIHGREYEIIQRPDGVEIASFAFHKALCRLNVSDYRVTQDAPDHLDVQVVPTNHWNESDEAAWRQRCDFLTAGKLRVDFHKVAEIPLAASGKRIQVLNMLRKQLPARQPEEAIA